jgi:ceramide glucosyltransferase
MRSASDRREIRYNRAGDPGVCGLTRAAEVERAVVEVSQGWTILCGFFVAALATLYGVLAWLSVRLPARRPPVSRGDSMPVTVLKPLCGAAPETYDCLRSFCVQNHPEYQVIFGVSDPDDPALAVVRRLQREFPRLDLIAVVERRQHGSNRKVSNLINMMAYARHDNLVLSDCDVIVQPDYLNKVTAPLSQPNVGIVTCAYRGVPRSGIWSLLGAMYINEWFIPSVRVAARAGSRSFAFGVSICIRRQVLTSIGGFTAVANQLADDYRLGELTRRLGLRTVLSEVDVDTHVREDSFGSLVRHELRWLRTIRALRPAGYSLSFVTFGVPVTALVALLSRGAAGAVVMLVIALLARVLIMLAAQPADGRWQRLLLLPVRDFLSFALWIWSFTTRRVQWRDDFYQISRDGSAQLVVRI